VATNEQRRLEMLLENKNTVIYGGGGAIGGAVARAFASEGAKVFLAGRTLVKLDQVALEISAAGGMAETAEVDALDEKAVDEHADAVAAGAGGIDIALNATGFLHVQGTPLAELSFRPIHIRSRLIRERTFSRPRRSRSTWRSWSLA
jgi:3-oxoacyl-[acyl-carrier protein] reductase